MSNIALFTSGHSRGSNFLAIYDYICLKSLPIAIRYIVVTDETAPIITLAHDRDIQTILYDRHDIHINNFLIDVCSQNPTDLIALCGFMRKLNRSFFESIKTPVINIHPALLPKYGGKGMYGMHVHTAVFASGDTLSGATVHYVNEHYDAGNIILQKTCDISDCHSPEEIAQRVLKIEHEIYPQVVGELGVRS